MKYLYSFFQLQKIVLTFAIAAQLLLADQGIAADLAPSESTFDYTISENNPPQSYRVLCYHDIRDDVLNSFKEFPEATAIDTQDFIKQMTWLKENGYHPISLQNILDAKAGLKKLPEKAILLTFDDGFKSVYTKVFPILKLLNYPAVIAIVGEWIETPQGKNVDFGDAQIPRTKFANWEDIREMVASGLVEVASHSHGLHKGILANPQGNSMPAAVVHAFSPENNQYETDTVYATRIQSDLIKNAVLIERQVHQRPRVMIWPYGMYNQVALASSLAAGMPVTMNLEPGPNTADLPLEQIHRSLMRYDDGVSGMIRILGSPSIADRIKTSSERFIGINLDLVYDPNPVVQEANISKLLDRMQRLHPSAVTLKAYSDLQHDGVAEAAYFPNRHLPMKADLFSRVAWQLRTRVGVKVYASMPVVSFDLPAGEPAYGHLVFAASGAPRQAATNEAFRLSIFDAAARNTIIEIYEDLAKSSIFTGILFGEDARLYEDEDASPAALAVYRDQWKLADSVASIRQDPDQLQRWATRKTEYLDDFIAILAKKVLAFQPDALTARSIDEKTVFDSRAEIHYAQNYSKSLSNYDFTAILVNSNIDEIKKTRTRFSELLKNKNNYAAANKLLFEFKIDQPNPAMAASPLNLVPQWQQIHLEGARHFGYYPDDVPHNIPAEDLIRPIISTQIEAIRQIK